MKTPRYAPPQKMFRALLTAGFLLTVATSAAAQGISSHAGSTSGSTGDSGDSSGSRRSSRQTLTATAATFQSRFAWNISSDVGVFSTRDTNGSAQHNMSFNVTAPGGYRLDISEQRQGMFQRNSDAFNCNGAADISGLTGTSNVGLSSGTLGLADPGGVGNGSGTTQTPFNQTTSAQIYKVSNGAAQAHTLTFTWSGTTRSNSCEAAVRLGEGSSVTGCGACVYPGSPSRTQANDGHFVTVTFTNLCGNGVIDASVGEQCDLGGANGSATSCCTSACLFRAGGQVCRVSAGVCDVADTCTGSSASCPADAKSSGVCRPAAGVCDIAESCDGSNDTCPGDAFASAATVCRASAGVCDVQENCTGSSAPCPGDAFAPSSTVCRGSAGVCDVAENCTGSAAACPGDAFEPSSTVC
ncbi:MAG: hypothetical protein IT294_17475, partial [Deltaproteobacteria bacterium]|nr:hypothetical protein [Deltaproteobacteria bacterium]